MIHSDGDFYLSTRSKRWQVSQQLTLENGVEHAQHSHRYAPFIVVEETLRGKTSRKSSNSMVTTFNMQTEEDTRSKQHVPNVVFSK